MPTDQLTGPSETLGVRSAFQLSVISGPDAGKQIEVTEAVTVGTHSTSIFCLTDTAVSRQHVHIEVTEIGATVVDLNSTNGTLLANLKTARFLVREEASFRIGRSVLKLRRTRPLETTVDTFGAASTANPSMRLVFSALRQAARGDVSILLQGETGTGKEILAEALHRASSRAAGPFVIVECPRMAADVMEAELFGSLKGSYTGAVSDREGLLLQAHQGTLFLDGLTEIPLEMQSRLLRFLVDKQVRPLGGSTAKTVDARVVASASQPVKPMVEKGAFRADLYYRLSGIVVDVPPLRNRPEDIELLFRDFLERAGHGDFQPAPELLAHLYSHPWPGNVRELRNFVSRTISGAAVATTEAATAAEFQYRDAKAVLVDAFTKQYFKALYLRCQGNVSEVARAAGLARPWVYEVLKRFQIHETDA